MPVSKDPDFLALLEQKRNFYPNVTSASGPKAEARQRDKNKAYLNESISLRLVPPSSFSSLDNGKNTSLESAGTWNIPRFRLTETFLRETVNRGKQPSSPSLLISHIHDPKTNSVILPKDLNQCRASVIYNVHVYAAVGIQNGGVLSGVGDSYYKGDLVFLIRNVPELSRSERFQVLPEDVHRWLVHGAISSVEAIQIQSSNAETIKQTLQQLQKHLKNVHEAPIFNEHGRAIVGSPLKDARERKFEFLKDEIEESKSRLEKSQQSFEAARARHFSACSLQITERSAIDQNRKDGKASFSVKVVGKKKEYYTNLIINNNDWGSVPMHATGDTAAKGKSKQKGNNSAIVLTIEEADQVEHFVDMGAVRIELLPDGFGVHEAYYECDSFATGVNNGNENSRFHHRLFHGHFCEGRYVAGTLHTNTGIFSGTFQSNEPCSGKMEFSDGIILTGDFALPPEGRGGLSGSPLLGPEQYRSTLPHGNDIHVQFKDISSYEGGMRHGLITGNGIYRYPNDGTGGKIRAKEKAVTFNEIKGEFVNGNLQNNDCVEGQRGSNLLRRSFMFCGERLRGP